ncbi:uncharacterized protein LOC131061134 isoform X2 [Cryptomeria japonica]|uniref:uncharacterized protein LOC131061134 isoform X2 n=1 Tax=Cryptomeria japonica TaxID=3369 RepID=UPI0027DA7736|nr:uncharacterized protein LOC131061134 isoform X2 [Cryptomeria japonica]
MTEQAVAILNPRKRCAEHRHKKKTKKTTADLSKTLKPKQDSEDLSEQENINEISGSDKYLFGEEDGSEEETNGGFRISNGVSITIAEEKEEEEEEEEEEEGYAGSSEEDEDEDGSNIYGEKKGILFTEGSNAFCAAFAKIMEKKVADDALGPVLSAHKKLIAKKLDEEANELKAKSEAKKEKRLIREKGHVKPENFLDGKEKSLIRLATKGVVKLFNAVSKAQSVQNAFDVSKSKEAKVATKESKAAFLSELRGASSSVKPGQISSMKTPSKLIAEAKNEQNNATKEPRWAPLRDDFMLTSSKLKDWDKMPDAAADIAEEMQGGDSDNSSDED